MSVETGLLERKQDTGIPYSYDSGWLAGGGLVGWTGGMDKLVFPFFVACFSRALLRCYSATRPAFDGIWSPAAAVDCLESTYMLDTRRMQLQSRSVWSRGTWTGPRFLEWLASCFARLLDEEYLTGAI